MFSWANQTHHPNGISIESAVFAQYTAVSNGQTDWTNMEPDTYQQAAYANSYRATRPSNVNLSGSHLRFTLMIHCCARYKCMHAWMQTKTFQVNDIWSWYLVRWFKLTNSKVKVISEISRSRKVGANSSEGFRVYFIHWYNNNTATFFTCMMASIDNDFC